MSVKIEINKDEYKELVAYCELNNLDVVSVVRKCFLEGYRIEKYGLLSGSKEPQEEKKVEYIEVVKEVIKEVPKVEYVEVIKEVPKIEYVEVIKQVPKVEYVEVIKEVPKIEYVEVVKEIQNNPTEVEMIKYVDREVIKEVIVEKTDETLKTKLDSLQKTLMILRSEIIEKDKKIKENEDLINKLKPLVENKAIFLKGSNLNNLI
jgi:hypothetical protein